MSGEGAIIFSFWLDSLEKKHSLSDRLISWKPVYNFCMPLLVVGEGVSCAYGVNFLAKSLLISCKGIFNAKQK
jgi:hypothetical protein